MTPATTETMPITAQDQPLWIQRSWTLWRKRQLLLRIAVTSLLLSLLIACIIPKRYKAEARIMPPEQQGLGAMMLAALAGHSGTGLGALGALAGDLSGGHSSTALYIGLLHSGTISGHIIKRFDLMHVYHERYEIDTAKRLSRNTNISIDKKSGILTIEVQDTDPTRARNIAQAYLDELNTLIMLSSTSSAHRERLFIEGRLASVQKSLEQAQIDFSDFSSRNTTVDLKEQTRALVDVGSRLQAELLVQQSGLQSLKQIYGDSNLRIRESEARIATLQHELSNLTGSSTPEAKKDQTESTDTTNLYPHLRELPRLAVPYADLYRRVKVQETVYDLLTQQYELARIEEAKDIPVVSVIDAPSIPERKYFPPRLLMTFALTLFASITGGCAVLFHGWWVDTSYWHPAKPLVTEILEAIELRCRRLLSRRAEVTQ